MRLIWTKSGSPLSRLIRWGLETDCSHFAFVFHSPAGGLMFEANLLGTHPRFFKNALKHMEVIHELNIDLPVKTEDLVWDIVVDELDGQGYDFLGFLYFCWRAILYKFFRVSYPKENKWQDPSRPLCVSIIKAIQKIGVELPKDFDPEIHGPHDLYELVLKVMKENNVTSEKIT